jgi:hypothetical protein
MKLQRYFGRRATSPIRSTLMILAVGIASRVSGDQTFYIGPNNGFWNIGANWDAGIVPPSDSDVIVGQFVPSRSGDVTLIFDGNYQTSNSGIKSLKLDANGTSGAIVMNQSSGTATLFAVDEFVGIGGHAAHYNQSAGANRPGSLYLGFDSGSTGTYVLSDKGQLNGNSDFFSSIYVGFSGMGSFSQTGGAVRIASLHLAETATAGGTYLLSSGTLEVTGTNNDTTKEIVGVGGSASFVQTNGTHTIGEFSNGHFNLGIGDGSSYLLSGGTLNLVRGSGDGNAAGRVANEGTFTISGGTFVLNGSDASINNYGPPLGSGVFNYNGGSILFPDGGEIDNSGILNVSVPVANLPVSVSNSDLIHVTAGTVSFGDTFTNNGQYLSSAPARQNFGTLNIGADGYLQGGAGDVFDVARNLTNNSTKPAEFDLTKCWLLLSGSGVTHRVAWPGADLGAVSAGYNDNFAIGVLKLASGNSLTLLDGNGTAGGALYVEVLQLDDGVGQIANIASSGISIYYDPNNSANNYLQGGTYQINGGGTVAPVASRTPPSAPTPSPTPIPTPTPAPSPTPAQALNISTRMRVQAGNDVLIGGFIVTGNAPKDVVVRGIGPSLVQFGVTDALADPTLELRSADGALIFANDDWQDNSAQAAQLTSLGLGLQNSKEAGISASLQPGAYSAILAGKDQTKGVGLVEVYDTNQTVDSQLGNISTRGFVLTDNNVMIGGFILGGNTGSTRVVLRGIGPSLAQFGLDPVLADPTLELHNSSGTTVVSNDNWEDDSAQAALLTANGFGLSDSKESGIFASLPPGQFTAILAGNNGGVGIGLVEIYDVP